MNDLIEFFKYNDLLPENQRRIAKMVSDFAEDMEFMLDNCTAKKQGFKRLLEARDWFIRASLD